MEQTPVGSQAPLIVLRMVRSWNELMHPIRFVGMAASPLAMRAPRHLHYGHDASRGGG